MGVVCAVYRPGTERTNPAIVSLHVRKHTQLARFHGTQAHTHARICNGYFFCTVVLYVGGVLYVWICAHLRPVILPVLCTLSIYMDERAVRLLSVGGYILIDII